MRVRTPAGREQMMASIRSLLEEFARQGNAGDAAALAAAFYAENAVLLPPNHPAVQGRASIGEFWKGLLAGGLSEVTLDCGDVSVSGGQAYGTGTYSWAVRRANKEPLRDRGKYMAVYRRQEDGSWRAVHHMFSSDQAGT